MSSPTRSPAARAVRYAALSQALSWLAVIIGLGFFVLFVAQAGLLNALLPQTAPTGPHIPVPDQITATESTVSGLDRESQPYQVKAKRGWQDGKRPALVHLEAIEAKFRSKSGAGYALSADTGLYDTKAKELDLQGNVVIAQAARFLARMDKAHVVVEEKKLTSAVPVAVTLENGTITANGLEISDDGRRILFLNGIKARFGGTGKKGDMNP